MNRQCAMQCLFPLQGHFLGGGREEGLIRHLQAPKCISVTPLIEIAPQLPALPRVHRPQHGPLSRAPNDLEGMKMMKKRTDNNVEHLSSSIRSSTWSVHRLSCCTEILNSQLQWQRLQSQQRHKFCLEEDHPRKNITNISQIRVPISQWNQVTVCNIFSTR